MTVSTTTSTITLLGDGATIVWGFPFACNVPANIKVSITDLSTGIVTPLASGLFEVILNNPLGENPTPMGGNVYYPLSGPPLAVGFSITISRILPFVQSSSFSNQSIIYPTLIEQTFDALLMMDQQNLTEEQTPSLRSFQVAASDPIPALVPSVALRASKPAVFDGSGNLTFGANVSTLTIGSTTISGGVTIGPDFLIDISGVLQEATATNATAFLDVFTSTLKGLTPPSGGGTTNFLRADGTWHAPPGGGGGTPGGSDTQLQYNSSSTFGGISGVTTNGTDLTALHIDDLAAIFWKDNTTVPGVYDAGLGRGAAKVLQVNDGTGLNANGWLQEAGITRATADFTKTSDTTLGNVLGLAVALQANRVYTFEASLMFATGASAGGIKVAMGGSVSVTNLIVDGLAVDGATNIACAQTSVLGVANVINTNAGTTPKVKLFGTIETGGSGGSLSVQFAQAVSNGTPSSVKRGSWLWVFDTP